LFDDTRPSIHTLPGDPPVEVALKRNARATRFSLRVSRTDGAVSLSMPVWVPRREALAFLAERADWVRPQLAYAPPPRAARIGAELPVLGIPRPIDAGSGRAARFTAGRLTVPPGPRQGPRLRALLTAMARERLSEATRTHAAAIGRPPGRLSLRDTRSRWGSCSSRGDLMFSWRLIMAPPEILDYVAAHEVAHLAEMNHGPAFWALCRRLCPATDRHRAWLRTHGAELLAWRFDSGPDEA
jgi:predicted metal-dependent hydrolase